MARTKTMVHIHVLRSYEHLVKAREYAEKGGLAVDWWIDQNINILAVSGVLTDICCLQSFIDGMYAI